MLWAFSHWLEAVAILPQLFMLQRTGEAETITTHYLFALGAYRALYIPNWLWRYFTEKGHFDTIPVLAGTTVLARRMTSKLTPRQALFRPSFTPTFSGYTTLGSCKAKSSTCQCRILQRYTAALLRTAGINRYGVWGVLPAQPFHGRQGGIEFPSQGGLGYYELGRIDDYGPVVSRAGCSRYDRYYTINQKRNQRFEEMSVSCCNE